LALPAGVAEAWGIAEGHEPMVLMPGARPLVEALPGYLHRPAKARWLMEAGSALQLLTLELFALWVLIEARIVARPWFWPAAGSFDPSMGTFVLMMLLMMGRALQAEAMRWRRRAPTVVRILAEPLERMPATSRPIQAVASTFHDLFLAGLKARHLLAVRLARLTLVRHGFVTRFWAATYVVVLVLALPTLHWYWRHQSVYARYDSSRRMLFADWPAHAVGEHMLWFTIEALALMGYLKAWIGSRGMRRPLTEARRLRRDMAADEAAERVRQGIKRGVAGVGLLALGGVGFVCVIGFAFGLFMLPFISRSDDILFTLIWVTPGVLLYVLHPSTQRRRRRWVLRQTRRELRAADRTMLERAEGWSRGITAR